MPMTGVAHEITFQRAAVGLQEMESMSNRKLPRDVRSRMTPVTPIKSVTSLRAVIEGFAAREAAGRVAQGTSADSVLQRFRDMQVVAAAGDYQRFAQIDLALHQAIVELANVPGLVGAWQSVFEAQNAFRLQTLKVCWPDISVLFESHRPLVDAVAAGEADEADQAARSHLDAVWFRLATATADESLPADPLARACAYLAFHFQEPIQLPELAREVAGCSSGHLARLFREGMGLSFSEYLIELRLQKGAWLVQHSDRTIRDIAVRVGYGDPSRFAMHFRRRFGETPAEFRRRLHPTPLPGMR
jgi:AraC-like DNA-binding protein